MDRADDGVDDLAELCDALEEADGADGADGAEGVDARGPVVHGEAGDGERDDEEVEEVPALAQEGEERVGEEVDEEVDGEEDGEEDVGGVEGARSVGVGEGLHLGLDNIKEKIDQDQHCHDSSRGKLFIKAGNPVLHMLQL